MLYYPPVIDPDTRIDFYAGSDKQFQQLKSIYELLDMARRGVFYVSPQVTLNGIPTEQIHNDLPSDIPLIISSYKDLNDAFYMSENRSFIMYEDEHTRETRGLLKTISLFLCRDPKTFEFRKTISKNVARYDTETEAIAKLLDYLKGKEVQHITHVNNKTVGIVYMTFGDKAVQAAKRSLATLRRLGYSYPTAFIGDFAQPDYSAKHKDIPWNNQTPFDNTKRHNFQFRAGRVKPFLYHYSPFDYTLYIDADTKFIQPIHAAFEMLEDHDILVTDEILTIGELYNKRLAGWEINLLERDTTMIELNATGKEKFVNSGVIFFRKNSRVSRLFNDWSIEWFRFQEWDEQLALMRAIHNNPDVNIKHLPVAWNDPHLSEQSVIFHDYGRGSVRQDA